MGGGASFFVSLNLLLNGTRAEPRILVEAALFVAVQGLVMCALTFPLALVSETFEYDVIRALNTPTILKRAQKHFGQQVLHHLTKLDWGFRFGGAVINTKIIVNILYALVLTFIASFVQAVSESVGF